MFYWEEEILDLVRIMLQTLLITMVIIKLIIEKCMQGVDGLQKNRSMQLTTEPAAAVATTIIIFLLFLYRKENLMRKLKVKNKNFVNIIFIFHR